ncbi:nickel-dependent hydrogenase large subunit [Shigella flexneri]
MVCANPINLDGLGVLLNLERLMYIKSFIDKLSDFVEQVYKVDTAVIAAFYPEWLTRGKGAVKLPERAGIPDRRAKRQLSCSRAATLSKCGICPRIVQSLLHSDEYLDQRHSGKREALRV